MNFFKKISNFFSSLWDTILCRRALTDKRERSEAEAEADNGERDDRKCLNPDEVNPTNFVDVALDPSRSTDYWAFSDLKEFVQDPQRVENVTVWPGDTVLPLVSASVSPCGAVEIVAGDTLAAGAAIGERDKSFEPLNSDSIPLQLGKDSSSADKSVQKEILRAEIGVLKKEIDTTDPIYRPEAERGIQTKSKGFAIIMQDEVVSIHNSGDLISSEALDVQTNMEDCSNDGKIKCSVPSVDNIHSDDASKIALLNASESESRKRSEYTVEETMTDHHSLGHSKNASQIPLNHNEASDKESGCINEGRQFDETSAGTTSIKQPTAECISLGVSANSYTNAPIICQTRCQEKERQSANEENDNPRGQNTPSKDNLSSSVVGFEREGVNNRVLLEIANQVSISTTHDTPDKNKWRNTVPKISERATNAKEINTSTEVQENQATVDNNDNNITLPHFSSAQRSDEVGTVEKLNGTHSTTLVGQARSEGDSKMKDSMEELIEGHATDQAGQQMNARSSKTADEGRRILSELENQFFVPDESSGVLPKSDDQVGTALKAIESPLNIPELLDEESTIDIRKDQSPAVSREGVEGLGRYDDRTNTNAECLVADNHTSTLGTAEDNDSDRVVLSPSSTPNVLKRGTQFSHEGHGKSPEPVIVGTCDTGIKAGGSVLPQQTLLANQQMSEPEEHYKSHSATHSPAAQEECDGGSKELKDAEERLAGMSSELVTIGNPHSETSTSYPRPLSLEPSKPNVLNDPFQDQCGGSTCRLLSVSSPSCLFTNNYMVKSDSLFNLLPAKDSLEEMKPSGETCSSSSDLCAPEACTSPLRAAELEEIMCTSKGILKLSLGAESTCQRRTSVTPESLRSNVAELRGSYKDTSGLSGHPPIDHYLETESPNSSDAVDFVPEWVPFESHPEPDDVSSNCQLLYTELKSSRTRDIDEVLNAEYFVKEIVERACSLYHTPERSAPPNLEESTTHAIVSELVASSTIVPNDEYKQPSKVASKGYDNDYSATERFMNDVNAALNESIVEQCGFPGTENSLSNDNSLVAPCSVDREDEAQLAETVDTDFSGDVQTIVGMVLTNTFDELDTHESEDCQLDCRSATGESNFGDGRDLTAEVTPLINMNREKCDNSPNSILENDQALIRNEARHQVTPLTITSTSDVNQTMRSSRDVERNSNLPTRLPHECQLVEDQADNESSIGTPVSSYLDERRCTKRRKKDTTNQRPGNEPDGAPGDGKGDAVSQENRPELRTDESLSADQVEQGETGTSSTSSRRKRNRRRKGKN